MKNTLKVLALGVAFATSVTIAKADTIMTGSTISVNGANFQFNTTNPAAATVTFAPNGTGPMDGNYTIGGSTGTFANYFTVPNPVTFFPGSTGAIVLPLGPMSTHTPPGGQLEILQTTENGETLTFYLTSESWMAGPDTTGQYTDLSVTGTGFFTLTGATNYGNENASFNFTSQQTPQGNVTDLVSFSGTGTALGPVPEPSSLALLGTGLLGAAAAARRRFVRNS